MMYNVLYTKHHIIISKLKGAKKMAKAQKPTLAIWRPKSHKAGSGLPRAGNTQLRIPAQYSFNTSRIVVGYEASPMADRILTKLELVGITPEQDNLTRESFVITDKGLGHSKYISCRSFIQYFSLQGVTFEVLESKENYLLITPLKKKA